MPEADQAGLHDAIYNPEWGVKAVSPVTPRAREAFLHYAGMLVDMGADAIILGCTEIPLALPEMYLRGVPLVNPVLALARALVQHSAPWKLRPLPNVNLYKVQIDPAEKPKALKKKAPAVSAQSPLAGRRNRKGAGDASKETMARRMQKRAVAGILTFLQ